MTCIAILDDDRTAQQLLEQALVGGDDAWSKAIHLSYFTRGHDLLMALQAHPFDVLILDRELPDLGGDEVLKWVRQHLPPQLVVIMVTHKVGISEASTLMMMGADDYISKPFKGMDLLARVRRLVERSILSRMTVNATQSNSGVFSLLGFEFNRLQLRISWQNESTQCTEREFELMVFMCRNAGRPLSREEIYEAVYHRRLVSSSRALDTLVHRVRSKLSLDERRGLSVQSIYGFGYRLDVLGGL